MKYAPLLAALFAGAALAAPPAGTKLANEANAPDTLFTITVPQKVSFGAGDDWPEKILPAGTYSCNGLTFDRPVTPGTARKECALTYAGGGIAPPVVEPPVVVRPVQIAVEGGSFTLVTTTVVTFGAGTKTINKSLVPGSYQCARDVFGPDPAPGVAKVCTVPSSVPVVEEPPVVVPPTDPVAGVTREWHTATAKLFGTEAGVSYRYGDKGATIVSTTLAGPRTSYPYNPISVQRNEVQSDGNVGDRPCGRDSNCGFYQFGTPATLTGKPGDYASNITNVAYLPDNVSGQKPYGIASLQQLSIAHNAIAWIPEPSWTTNYGPSNGWNDENVMKYAGALSGSKVGTIPMANPVFITRGYGRGGWVNNAITCMSNGWCVSSGSNTSNNQLAIKLPDGFTPTAGAITNSGEFLLVTAWDTAAFKGKVIVVALADGCAWCEQKPESQWEANWGSARGAYHGMPGLGNYLAGKVIGAVDLPDSMKAPTEISVSTGKADAQYQRVRNFWNDNFLDENSRRRFYDGDLTEAIARTGMAVVVSKTEKRAAFIDLKPLFQYYRTQYLAKDQNGWNQLIGNRGAGASQWPFTFDFAPAQKPVVAKVVDLPEAPTAVRVNLETPFRAFIATQEGKLRVFDLGSEYLRQDGNGTGNPDQIVEKAAITVGANPTSIGYMKEHACFGAGNACKVYGNTPAHRHLWVLSRAAKKADLLQFNMDYSAATVLRTVQDSRLEDPISIEDGDNHGTESYTVTIADYSGKKVHTLGYGPIITWTYDERSPCPKPNGCTLQPNGYEYAGGYNLPGKPTHIISANIN